MVARRVTTQPQPEALEFGNYLRYVRDSVYGESIRTFAKRIGISPGYLGKLELGHVGIPRRATIESIAQSIAIDDDILLNKAGYAARNTGLNPDTDILTLKLRRVRPDLVPVILDIIDTLATKYPKE